ncbi:MAG: hypothetical protein ACXWNR_06095 [Candidatus Limnocylindrales bacterium]
MDRGSIGPSDAAVRESADSERRLPSRRPRRSWLVAPALALVAIAGVLFWLNPWQPPRMLHVWGHDYTSTGEVCMTIPCEEPPAAAPVTMEEALKDSLPVVVVHGAFGPLSWFGLTDAGSKPSNPVWRVYLQVGPDFYVPYKWTTCCEPQW